ncbi:hypothetical protein U1Q18_006697, partial [Sarracenia purpurea var. burkii]
GFESRFRDGGFTRKMEATCSTGAVTMAVSGAKGSGNAVVRVPWMAMMRRRGRLIWR